MPDDPPVVAQVASPVHFTRRGELKSFMLAGAPKEPQLPVLPAQVGLWSSECYILLHGHSTCLLYAGCHYRRGGAL